MCLETAHQWLRLYIIISVFVLQFGALYFLLKPRKARKKAP